MEVKFRISVKAIELSNFLLGESMRALKAYPERMKQLDLTDSDLELIEEFRQKTVKTLTKSKGKTLVERQKIFYSKLIPYISEYGKVIVRDFYEYWTEHNENGKKMKFEMQKVFDIKRRLVTWSKNQKRFNNDKSDTKKSRIERFLEG